MDVQKLWEPEISPLLQCMLQFLNNLWWLYIFSKYIEEIDITYVGPSEKFQYLFLDLWKSFF